MSRAMVTIRRDEDRQRVITWATKVPWGTRVTFQESKRTLEQNALMWSKLTDVARQKPWHGMRLSADDWKLMFLDALKREVRAVPNIDGTGFVNLGRSSSELSKGEMSDLIELINAFGAKHEIKWTLDDNSSPSHSEDRAGAGRERAPSHGSAPVRSYGDL